MNSKGIERGLRIGGNINLISVSTIYCQSLSLISFIDFMHNSILSMTFAKYINQGHNIPSTHSLFTFTLLP